MSWVTCEELTPAIKSAITLQPVQTERQGNREGGAVEKWQVQDRWNGPPDRLNDTGYGADRGMLVKVFGECWQTGNKRVPVITLDSEVGRGRHRWCGM